MSRFENDNYAPHNMQKDLVLSVNEFVFLQSRTDGSIKTQAGPMTITISQQEALVIFNAKSKKFEETNDFEKAKQLFIAPPEGWYTILKNPTSDGQYPTQGKANITPTTITVGKKINEGLVEFKLRCESESLDIKLDEIVNYVKEYIDANK